jgi:hypothetical protein
MKSLLKKFGPVRRAIYRLRGAGSGQTDEGAILQRLAAELNAPHTFVEFGFHPAEYNCADLARQGWQGLLIDGDARQVADARIMLPSRIRIKRQFLALDNLSVIRGAFLNPGVMSIDVDGNDYWFAEALFDLRPKIMCVEYNASFGLEPVTVPYDPAFDRTRKHPTGWYHGASLTALTILARKHGYGLHAVSAGGGNAFFTESGTLDPAEAWRPSVLRDKWAGNTWQDQWAAVKDMPFVNVADT